MDKDEITKEISKAILVSAVSGGSVKFSYDPKTASAQELIELLMIFSASHVSHGGSGFSTNISKEKEGVSYQFELIPLLKQE